MFIKVTKWTNGPCLLLNTDTILQISESGNSPPARRITFRREEAREHLDVNETLDEIAAQSRFDPPEM